MEVINLESPINTVFQAFSILAMTTELGSELTQQKNCDSPLVLQTELSSIIELEEP